MLENVPARKLVLEWRYPPDLHFYGKMDEIALKFADQFKDWERSALTVEVREKVKHRRTHLAFNRSFYEVDSPKEPSSECEIAYKFLDATAHALNLTKLTRVGLRYWFAIDLGLSFPALVDLVHDRFYAAKPLAEMLPETVKDVSFITYYTHSNGWQFNLRVGPMESEQWFREIKYEPALHQSDDDPSAFAKLKKSIPEQFLYVDVDYFKEDVRLTDVPGMLVELRAHCQELVSSLKTYCSKE